MAHARTCPHCNFEFQSLASAKRIVHDRLPRLSVPADVYYSIVNATIRSSGRSWFSRLFGISLNPAVALVLLAVVAVGLYSMFFPSAPAMSEEANIISQSVKNYRAVIGGAIKPQLVSTEENVRTFLMNEVGFDVNVPKMKGCNSCAGVLSDFKGIKLAHVVYQVDSNIIYIYQAPMNDAMEGSTIGIPDEAKAELEKSDWYVRELENNTTLVMWRYKNTLCSAVSDMKKEQLMALLSSKEELQ